MEFLWPGFLFLLVLIPVLVGLYIWMLRRRRFAVRYSSLELVRAALPKKSNWRRHLPVALFLLGLTSLVFALGRPVAILNVPTNQTTIILTMDVSGSMRSHDIPPSRLEAAEEAAFSFIQHQKATTQIGLVVFSGCSATPQPTHRLSDSKTGRLAGADHPGIVQSRRSCSRLLLRFRDNSGCRGAARAKVHRLRYYLPRPAYYPPAIEQFAH